MVIINLYILSLDERGMFRNIRESCSGARRIIKYTRKKAGGEDNEDPNQIKSKL
jgi:hypothetical protein